MSHPVAGLLVTLLASRDERPARLNPNLEESDIADSILSAIQVLESEGFTDPLRMKTALNRLAAEAMEAAKG